MSAPLENRFRTKFRKKFRDLKESRSIRRVSGPRKFNISKEDVVVISPIIDAMYWLPGYLKHYRELGVAGFVLVDTGSSDETLEFLSREPDVVVLACPSFKYQSTMRVVSARRYAAGAWALFADIDELFDPPHHDPLPNLTRDLIKRGFTAMPAIMLDMFPKGPILRDYSFEDAVLEFNWFEAQSIELKSYDDKEVSFQGLLKMNKMGSSDLRMAFGGVRKRIFNENPCLTKHPLVHVKGGITAGYHPHCSTGTIIADFHGVLRHYKFTNRPDLRDRASVSLGTRSHGEDKARLAVFEKDDEISLWSNYALPYSGFSKLAELGLILPRR